MENNNKKIWVLLGVVVLLVVIIIIAANSGKKNAQTGSVTNNQAAPAQENTAPGGDGGTAVTSLPEGATVVVPGTSPVSKDDVVLTPTGEAVQNDVAPLTPDAPKQTGPIAKEQLSNEVVKLEVSTAGFSPKEFTVNSGDPVTFALTSMDQYMHVLVFDDASLKAVANGVGPGETRAMTFNAPAAGEYTFRCGVPGHAARGEVGKMIVK